MGLKPASLHVVDAPDWWPISAAIALGEHCLAPLIPVSKLRVKTRLKRSPMSDAVPDMDGAHGTPEEIIRVRGLRKIYHVGDVEVPALRGVDLDVKRGEFLAHHRPFGFRQIDTVSHSRRASASNCRRGLDRRSGPTEANGIRAH